MKFGNTNITIKKGDITKEASDAIVNAANPSLMGGGGVDGAIHRAGGASILKECKTIVAKMGNCKPGNAVMTGAGNLQCKHIIHAVGPIWHGGNEQEPIILQKAYHRCLEIADENKLTSVAFPNISTGVYGYPKNLAVRVVKSTVENYLKQHKTSIKELIFMCFDDANYELYQRQFQ